MDSNRWSNVTRLRRDYEKGAERLSGLPLEAFIEVSARCNLRCPMCAIGFDDRYQVKQGRPDMLSPELFAELRPLFPTLLRAHLYGLGEPLLNPHLTEFVRELSAAGVHTRTTSNGTLIDGERAEALAAAGLERISLSIDGATPATYEAIRRGARFSSVRRALVALAEARRRHGLPQVTVNFVAMASNLEELPRLVDLVGEAGVEEMNVEPLYDWGGSEPELGLFYERENLARLEGRCDPGAILGEARRLAEEAGISFSSRLLTDGGSWDYRQRIAEGTSPRWVCSEPYTTLSVTTAGEVRVCCLNDTCFGCLSGNGHHPAAGGSDDRGKHRGIEAIWNGPELARFRRSHLHHHQLDRDRVGGDRPSGQGSAVREASAQPPGCGSCFANGRMRHSPFLAAVEAVSYRPLLAVPEPPAPAGYSLDGPHDGEVVTDPLVVTGRLPRRMALRGERAIGSLSQVEVLIDRTPAITLGQTVRFYRRFVLQFSVPYLSEGAHILSLRIAGHDAAPGWSRRTVHFHRPPLPEGVRPVTRIALVRLLLTRPTPRPSVRIGGLRWDGFRWSLHRDGGDRWSGTVVLDLEPLAAGRHHLVVEARGHPQVSLSIEHLPES